MECPISPDPIAEAATRLRAASRVLFITGAGLSADSGLPTYRGIGGLYDDRATDDGMPIEVALSGSMLGRDPAVCWKYIHQIEQACRGAGPNRGHEVLAEIEREAGLSACVILTQNVDGFHRAAGSKDVIEIHGDIHQLTCVACEWVDRAKDYTQLKIPPSCPSCSALVRPQVVLFGEMLPATEVKRLQEELALGSDVVVSVGTTSVFPYIAAPIGLTRDRGGYTLEINPGETEVTRKIAAGAAVPLDAVWTEWRRRRRRSSSSSHATNRRMAESEGAVCERILRSLPTWFGDEPSLVEYCREINTMETHVVEVGGEVAGFLTLRTHNEFSSEIHVMAVRVQDHRRGLGRALVEYTEQILRARSCEYLHVKTLGPSRPNAEYERTRRFYLALGFRPLEENGLWAEDTPCLMMVKHLC